MPPVQTSYTIGMAVGFPGMIADASMIQDIETHYNPEGAVFFGRVVTRGAAATQIVHPDAAAEITDEKLVRGLVVATQETVSSYPNDNLDPAYPAAMPVPVMRKGRMWVLAEDTITEGTSTVNVRYLAGAGGTKLGSLRGASVVNETAVLPKSKWKTSTSGAGQLAIVEIDL